MFLPFGEIVLGETSQSKVACDQCESHKGKKIENNVHESFVNPVVHKKQIKSAKDSLKSCEFTQKA